MIRSMNNRIVSVALGLAALAGVTIAAQGDTNPLATGAGRAGSAVTWQARAQGPPAPQAPLGIARYRVELRYCCMSGDIHAIDSEHVSGTDVMSGEVEGNEGSTDIVEYTGKLTRTTNLPYCNMYTAGGVDKLCIPVLDGAQSAVDVTIQVWRKSENTDTAWIEYTPKRSATDHANVSGACTAGMGVDMKNAYFEKGTIQIVPTGGRLLIDRLWLGKWQDADPRPPNQPDGWTLEVKAKVR